ncbi:MAG TPA: hypothetical protein PKW15_00270 [Alphaproteobacteria bacterium]|nr:hypothetical protein [Rhodospirillaceae bacterium]HRJ11659.1 hypothetical protein [Alphaproteobacteria bacterium]
MSNLTPTTPVSGSATSGGGSGGDASYQSTPARIVNLPSSLQNLQQNVMLGARLVGANGDGSVILRTAQGDLTLNVPINVPPGASLQVQLQPGNPPTAVLVLFGGEQGGQAANKLTNAQLPAIDISGLATNGTGSSSSSTAAATIAAATANLPELKLNAVVRVLVMEALQALATSTSAQAREASSSLSALLAKPEVLANMLEQLAAKAGATPSNVSQAQLLSQLGLPGKLPNQIGTLSLSPKLLETVQQTLLLLQQQPGGTKGLSNDQNALLQLLQASQTTSASSQARTAAPLIISQLFPGMELNLKLVQIIPPQPGTTTPTAVTVLPSPTGNLTISGQITPQLVNGQPVVQTEQGNLLLQASSKLSVGTTLVFELVQNAARTTGTQTQLIADAIKLNSALPKLEQAMLMMSQVNSEIFTAMMNTMPKLNGQFPITALFFFQALHTGNIRNWLGDKTLQMLRQSGSEGAKLVEELGKEFSQISAKAKSATPGEWRQITVPYLNEHGLSTMRFAVRDHYQNAEDDPRHPSSHGGGHDPNRVTRFLFDIEFSEIGPLQIDGLMRPGTDIDKQLDIVLRTRELLPSEMRRDLRELFSESLGAYGMSGGLSFQAGYQNWIKLAEERSSGARI